MKSEGGRTPKRSGGAHERSVRMVNEAASRTGCMTPPLSHHVLMCIVYKAVIIRMQERKKRRAQLGDRKSAAAQSRMKSIASLAADVNAGKKRKKQLDGELH